MRTLISMVLFYVLSMALPALADDRPDHYEGKPAETLEEAVSNFSESNAELAAILNRASLSPHDLHEIHELTYTLENALARIRTEFAGLAGVLEEVHVASETGDAATVKAKGEIYLDTARQVIED